MDADIAAILVQDGIVNGAVYALLALSLVLVFSVTRVILIPQGEFVAFGALTYAALDAGRVPGSVWLLSALGLAACVAGLWAMRHHATRGTVLLHLVGTVLFPAAVTGLTWVLAGRHLGVALDAALTLLIVAPMAPYVYQVAFHPLAEASVLVLLIAAVGVHLALMGMGLVMFGPGRVPRDRVLGCGAVARPAHGGRAVLVGRTELGRDHGGAVWLLRPYAVRQGAACDGGEPAGRAAGRHLDGAVRPGSPSPLPG